MDDDDTKSKLNGFIDYFNAFVYIDRASSFLDGYPCLSKEFDKQTFSSKYYESKIVLISPITHQKNQFKACSIKYNIDK